MVKTFNPPHPGETLRNDVLPALGLSVTKAAEQLNVSRAAICPEMALRLVGWLGVENGGRADLWVAQQAPYDLWNVRKAGLPKVERLELG